MNLETRIREHLAAKAATIPADPPPLPAAVPPAREHRWRPALALAAAVIVALAVGAAAWLFRAGETVAPVAPDLEELTPTLQGSVLDWTQVGGVEPGFVVALLAVDGDVVLFDGRLPDDAARPPLRMWRAPAGEPLAPVAVDADAFGPLDVVTEAVWDGERFLAFGGRYNADPARRAGTVVESLVWTSADGRSWERRPLLDQGPAAGASPFAVRTAFAVGAAASERGVLVAAVLEDAFDWDGYLADRLGAGYVPGSLFSIDFDAGAGVYRLRDAENRLLLEVGRAEVGFDGNAVGRETAVLYSADGASFTRVDVVPATAPAGALTVQAGREGLFVLNPGGPVAPGAWFSTDGETWVEVDVVIDGEVLEALPAQPWRNLLLGAVSGLSNRTVVASADGEAWLPISPPLEGADGMPLPTDGIVAGEAGILVHGYEIRVASGPDEVIVRRDGYRVFSYPQTGRLVLTPSDSTEAVLVASFAEVGPSGLPIGFEPGPDGAVRALDRGSGEVLVELTAADWAQLDVEAEGQAPLAVAWFTPDGERWGREELADTFGRPGLVAGAAVAGDAVVVLFQPDPPAHVFSPMPGTGLQVWVGRPG